MVRVRCLVGAGWPVAMGTWLRWSLLSEASGARPGRSLPGSVSGGERSPGGLGARGPDLDAGK